MISLKIIVIHCVDIIKLVWHYVDVGCTMLNLYMKIQSNNALITI